MSIAVTKMPGRCLQHHTGQVYRRIQTKSSLVFCEPDLYLLAVVHVRGVFHPVLLELHTL